MTRRFVTRATGCALVLGAHAVSAGCRRPPPADSGATAAPQEYTRSNEGGSTYALVNGLWLRGGRFEPRTLYSVAGILRERRPARVDSVIDLTGRYVIPPFGDAHSHNLSFPSPRQDSVRRAYLDEGSFYVQVLSNRRTSADKVRGQFNHPCALDVTYAHGSLTSTLGHGFETYEPRAMGLTNIAEALRTRSEEIKRSRIAEGDAYWFIDSLPDLIAKWPAILAGRPDIVKIHLLFTRDTALPAPPPWPPERWYMHGIDPSVVPAIVERAHAAGLGVAAHVETAHDFEVAVRAGVDVIAHLLGPDVLPGWEGAFRIGDDVARLAGARGVVVVPTVAISKDITAGHPDRLAQIREKQRENLRLLTRHGVRFAIGRDEVWHTAREEFEALRELGVWDAPTLLRIWSEETARSIFPGRRVGRLEDGYEASFLALRRNPLENLDAVRDITLRVKQGCVLE